MQFFVKYRRRYFILVLFAFAVRCQQQEFVSDSAATLNFSSDTLCFDTVFSPLGSTTFSCKVYNPGSKNLLFDEVRLRGEDASPFRMNVDGRAGYSVSNVKLAKKDSLFIFLEVKKNKSLLLADAVVFVVNGVELASRLEVTAYGQDAVVFDRDTALHGAYTFTADKPYILHGAAAVDSDATVTVAAGAKLYFGAKAGIAVHGTLKVEGTPENPCVFSFPRYNDPWYSDATGQWEGVSISATGRASVSGARIRGARCAFDVTDTLSAADSVQLTLKNSMVEYANVGMRISNGKVNADNCLFAGCLSNALLVEGGSCNFYHCTFACDGLPVTLQSYRLRERAKPNSYDTIPTPLEAYFANSIIYGSSANGLSVHEQKGRAPMRLKLENCIVKLSSSYDLSDGERYVGVITEKPAFKDADKNDFHLSEKSPAVNAGLDSIAAAYPVDADGYDRSISHDKSLGCYAYKP
ncbi:MAG: hypothetical protein LBB79_01125 [Prevotellaceae bacterium]|jgi:hypothetical protein|nr:hypothetical protein [Prevotellaceae bacterium]